jgi:RNA polymerase sigma factor (sigma-70 family)
VLRAAVAGDLAALGALIVAVQPGVFNLALRMLGGREDAADATQEILLKLVTHLGGFRGDAAFTTWVFQVARHHLLSALERRGQAQARETSFEALADKLGQGLDYFDALPTPRHAEEPLTPEEQLEVRQVALGCTQHMLMALDAEQRLVVLLDIVFGLSGAEAAAVLEISADAYRQRLSRARSRLEAFTAGTCGLLDETKRCQCRRQLPALQHVQAQAKAQGVARPVGVRAQSRAELAEAETQFESLRRMSDAAALLRLHPQYQAPPALHAAIRAVLRSEGQPLRPS